MSITEIKQEPNRTEKKELRYDFDEKEIVELARKQGFKHKDLDVVEAEKKMSASQFKGRIEILEGEIEACTDKIMAGFEMRMIEVGVFYHTPKQGYKTSVRLDTGETVDEDRMSQAECQSHLPLEEVEEPEAEEAKALPDHGWTLMDNEKPDREEPVMFRDSQNHEWIGWITQEDGKDVLDDDSADETDSIFVAIAWRSLTDSECQEREGNSNSDEDVDGWKLFENEKPDAERTVMFRDKIGDEWIAAIVHDEVEDCELIVQDDGKTWPFDTVIAWRDLTDEETAEQEGNNATGWE